MDSDDLAPLIVFEGDPADAVFLKSLLASGGIDAQIVAPVRSGRHKVTVRRMDAADARAMIEDFHRRKVADSD
ncbi:MAG TPA: hypothetical protein VN654_20330 [Vicinamibacterales bacterium]|nr:hypothetical protein [Vicinamibacterales bacterium]